MYLYASTSNIYTIYIYIISTVESAYKDLYKIKSLYPADDENTLQHMIYKTNQVQSAGESFYPGYSLYILGIVISGLYNTVNNYKWHYLT